MYIPTPPSLSTSSIEPHFTPPPENQGGTSFAPAFKDISAVRDRSSRKDPPASLSHLDPLDDAFLYDDTNSSRPSGPLEPVCYLVSNSFPLMETSNAKTEALADFRDCDGRGGWVDNVAGYALTVRVLPRPHLRIPVVEKMQQRRPDLPARVQLVPPHAPGFVPLERVQQEHLVRFRDLAAMVGEVEVHGRGLLRLEGGDEGVYAQEDAFGGLDADGHGVAGQGLRGEDGGVGGVFEVDFDFRQGFVES